MGTWSFDYEREVINRCMVGDPVAWSLLFKQFSSNLLWLATFLTGCTEDAEDLVSAVWCRVIQRKHWEHKNYPTFLSFLRRVLIGMHKDSIRRLSSRPPQISIDEGETGDEGLANMLPDGALPLEDEWSQKEEFERVTAAVQKLPQSQREVIIKRVWCELTRSEIAEDMEMKLDSVTRTVNRALAELKQSLSGE